MCIQLIRFWVVFPIISWKANVFKIVYSKHLFSSNYVKFWPWQIYAKHDVKTIRKHYTVFKSWTFINFFLLWTINNNSFTFWSYDYTRNLISNGRNVNNIPRRDWSTLICKLRLWGFLDSGIFFGYILYYFIIFNSKDLKSFQKHDCLKIRWISNVFKI